MILISSLVALAAVAAVTHAGDAPAAAGDSSDGITVQGTASVTSTPDRAQVSFGVESPAATAKAALAANAVEMRKVLAALKAAGATDLKTQSVTLNARYGDAGSVQGYVAANTVSASVRDVTKAGAVIDAAVDAGANQVYGPFLSRSGEAELYRQALKAAVADARSRAQVLASAANLSLGKVTAIVESGSGPAPIALEAMKASDAGGTPVEPGTQETTATITVTFSVT